MTVADTATGPLPGNGRSGDSSLQRAISAVWSDHPDEEYRRDLAHWRGHGRWNEAEWWALVETAARRVRDLCRTGGLVMDPTSTVALDWGCGGGAGLVALAPTCSRLYGVDVADASLTESRRQLDLLDPPAPPVTTILATADASAVAHSVQHPIDLLISVSTFHLLPDKELAADILRTAFVIMAPEALGYVTIRFDDGTPKYRARQGADRYLVDHVFASSWQISEFWGLLQAIGFTPLKVSNLNTSVNFCSFYFRK